MKYVSSMWLTSGGRREAKSEEGSMGEDGRCNVDEMWSILSSHRLSEAPIKKN